MQSLISLLTRHTACKKRNADACYKPYTTLILCEARCRCGFDVMVIQVFSDEFKVGAELSDVIAGLLTVWDDKCAGGLAKLALASLLEVDISTQAP